jgi:hypothetical protein
MQGKQVVSKQQQRKNKRDRGLVVMCYTINVFLVDKTAVFVQK